MFVASLRMDLLLPQARSLKDKRAVLHPVLAELTRRFPVSAAQVGHADLHRRALLGVAVTAGEAGRCQQMLDGCERLVAARPEIELLSARRRLWDDEDE